MSEDRQPEPGPEWGSAPPKADLADTGRPGTGVCRHPSDLPAEAPPLAEMLALVRVVLWAALIALGGWLSLPLLGVPFSLQTFFVILAGLLEGPKIGASAAGLYLLAGFLGLPVFTGGLGGPAIIFQPSAGFALAFPLGAAVAGLARRHHCGQVSFRWAFSLALTGGLVIIYAFGFLGLMLNTALTSEAAGLLLLAFVPGDLLKFAAAALLASRSRSGR